MLHISHNDETWHSFTSPKDPKNESITWCTPWVLLVSGFLPENGNFCYIGKNILKLHFYTFFFNSFHLYSVVIGVFKQHDCYFVHAINIGHSRPSWHRGILKSMLWLALHDFCPWFHQQNFITWFKLYSRCFHVTKVSNFRISTREVIITSFLWGFDHWFFWGVVLVQVR